MAVDEALAEAVGNGDSPPVVRLYGFSPPTLSLGRFQKAKGLLSARRLAEDDVTFVRRPTGGHAVLHDDELTYSVALAKETGPSTGIGKKRDVYLFIARVLLRGLGNLGVTGAINSAQRGDVHNPDCFASTGEYEIAGKGGKKLIGSAQMTTRRAILQHGSIPLQNPGQRVFRYLPTPPPAAAALPSCLNEETGRVLGFEEVRDAFARAFRDEIGARDSELLPAERENAERIRAAKYESDAWNLAW